MTDTRYTYTISEDGIDFFNEDACDYPYLDNDEPMEGFIEERRIQYREEWFQYVETNEVYDYII